MLLHMNPSLYDISWSQPSPIHIILIASARDVVTKIDLFANIAHKARTRPQTTSLQLRVCLSLKYNLVAPDSRTCATRSRSRTFLPMPNDSLMGSINEVTTIGMIQNILGLITAMTLSWWIGLYFYVTLAMSSKLLVNCIWKYFGFDAT